MRWDGKFLLSLYLPKKVNVTLAKCPPLMREAADRRSAKTVQALSVERMKTASVAVLHLILSTS